MKENIKLLGKYKCCDNRYAYLCIREDNKHYYPEIHIDDSNYECSTRDFYNIISYYEGSFVCYECLCNTLEELLTFFKEEYEIIIPKELVERYKDLLTTGILTNFKNNF